jgi:peptidyl-prolyl cis-trans isomerase SurA
MNENETQSTDKLETVIETTTETVETKPSEPVQEPVLLEEKTSSPSKSKIKGYIIAVVVVIVIILGALYLLEKENRSSTNIFGAIIASQEANAVVAVVNGQKIINSKLDTSIKQFSQAATAQGVDITGADVQANIRSQALDVLVNTELLKQAATSVGINITDEEVSSRLETIKEEIGGEEILTERMNTLGITQEQLKSDVKDEIIIQQLLDKKFQEANISVSEEEILKVYEDAGGVDAGLPPLEEVKPQVEAQIRSTKEQEVINKYLGELKTGAEIEIK